jgi:hypothetical protein
LDDVAQPRRVCVAGRHAQRRRQIERRIRGQLDPVQPRLAHLSNVLGQQRVVQVEDHRGDLVDAQVLQNPGTQRHRRSHRRWVLESRPRLPGAFTEAQTREEKKDIQESSDVDVNINKF